MDFEAAKQRIALLREEIDYHSRRYYDEDAPEIEDDEFDALTRQLRRLEEEYPALITADSYTQRVHGELSALFSPVRHEVPLTSLQDVFSIEDVREFDRRVRETVENPRYVVEPKIDGLSIALTYENGVFVKGATRGDGEVGEDVTANLRGIGSVPAKISCDLPKVIVRGEVYMPRKSFADLVTAQEQNGEKAFKNPRNAAAGSLRQKDPAVTKSRNLDIFVFNLQKADGITITGHDQSLTQMENWGFHMIPFRKCTGDIEEVIREIDRIGEVRHSLPFDIDGAVIKVDGFADRERLGYTSKFPKWAVAFKYPPEEKETTLIKVETTVGRTGVITPTGVFEPVVLSGSTVSRATLHNEEFISEKGLCIGDTVVLRKAGDIIPEVVRVKAHLPHATPYVMPETCPSCGERVVREEGEAALRCTNPLCPAQRLQNLIHFACRDAMDIEGLGPAVIEALVGAGLVNTVCDLYRLLPQDIAALERLGEKSAANLSEALERSKQNDLYRVIFALGIRHIGQKAAKLLAEHFGTMEALSAASEEELCRIDGVGEIMAKSIRQFFLRPQSLRLIDDLRALGINMRCLSERADRRFEGMTFVLTGTLPTLKRDEASLIIENHAGKVAGSVSKKTTVVLAGEDAGSKLVKARQLGIRIIDEEEFRDMLTE